jgi:hypothetical protein
MRILSVILLVFLFSFSCFSKKNKEIIIAHADTMNYKQHQEYLKKYKLIDLTKSTDSAFIRFTFHFSNGNKILYELKTTAKGWKARIIYIGKGDFHSFDLGLVLFKKYQACSSKKTKKANYQVQIKMDPLDFFYTSFVFEIIDDTISPQPLIVQKLFQFKSQCESDSSKNKVSVDSSCFYYTTTIEISTPVKYKYLYWPASYVIPDNYHSNIIGYLSKDLYDLLYLSKKKYIFKNYHKNHWAK